MSGLLDLHPPTPLKVTRIDLFSDSHTPPKVDGIEVSGGLVVDIRFDVQQPVRIMVEGSRVLYPTEVWHNRAFVARDFGSIRYRAQIDRQWST